MQSAVPKINRQTSRLRAWSRRAVIALIVLLPLAAGILLVSTMFQSRLVLSDDVAELRQRHGRLAGRIAAMPAFDPSMRDLTGLAAEARTLIAPIERLEHPQAGTAAAYARQLAELAARAARSDDPQTARMALNDLRRTEAGLAATLTAIQRDVERSRGWRAWLAGGGLAGLILLSLLALVAVAMVRGRLARALISLADVVEGMTPAMASEPGSEPRVHRVRGLRRLRAALQRYERAIEAARGRVVAALDLRQSLIDSLPAAVALLDSEGRIVHVNGEWRYLARSAQDSYPQGELGADYLGLCEAADRAATNDGTAIAAPLRAILDGDRSSLELEYPCHAPNRLRWFRMMVRRVAATDRAAREAAAVVMHVNVTERKLAEQKLARVAYVDPLTGLPTRAGLTQRLEEDLPALPAGAVRYLVILDLQNLHNVNETYGYEAGDELLAAMGSHLGRALEATERLARVGGDQFALLVDPESHGLATDDEGAAIAAWIEGLIAEPFRVTGRLLDIGVWIGIAQAQPGVDATDLLRRAALAAHIARDRSGITWVSYNRDLDERVNEWVRTTRALDASLVRGDFELYYQPAVRLSDGGIISAEALLRWRDPEHGLRAPGSFMQIAETSRLIVPIGDWVIREACRQLRAWHDEGLPARIAVNISRVQFAHADVAASVEAALTEHGVDPGDLWLEVTETAFEEDTGRLLKQLERLNALGVGLALDDFGTGYSSLTYLQQYPFDIIKIDQRFTRGIGEEQYSREVVRLVRALAHTLDARVIAEGVETLEQRARLLELGCIFGQGYYYSVPLSAEDFYWLLTKGERLPLRKALPDMASGIASGDEWAG